MWIKPSELPKDFHQHCWVCYRGWTNWFEPTMVVVQNHYRGNIPEYYSGVDGGWQYLSDEHRRVMLIDKPEKPK